MNTIYTQIGLLLDVVGVTILFFFGPPISEFLPDGSEIVCNGDLGVEQARNKIKVKKEHFLSRIGLIYLFMGFLYQFIGSIK